MVMDLAFVACGRLDGFWGGSLRPWDIAGGNLLIREAGGFVTDFKGGEEYFKNSTLAVGGPHIQKALLKEIGLSLEMVL